MLAELPLLARYSVTGDDAVYAIPFRVYRAEDVAVTFSTNGRTETALTLGKDYSVQILPAGGAELTLAAGVAGGVVPAGAVLAIASAVPATQEADFSNTATVNTGALETQLDREVQMIQQLKDGLALAVKVPAAGNQSPEELLAEIFDAKDAAASSAGSAQANANAAADSARSAAGSAAIATEAREAACICAGEAQAARDVAIAQAEAANTLMEAELAKVNAIVAANKTDQRAAVTAARAWAEKAPDTPVDYDEEGNPRYSARHWAENAQKIAIEPPTAERRGAIRVGAGLHLTTGENGETDVLAPDMDALGGSLRLNSELWLTESGTFTAPVTGWFRVLCIAGGEGSFVHSTIHWGFSGCSGEWKEGFVYLEQGETVDVVVGAGGKKRYGTNWHQAEQFGGDTSFAGIVARGAALDDNGEPVFRYGIQHAANNGNATDANSSIAPALGPGGTESAPTFYGAGAGCTIRGATYNIYDGYQGAVRLAWHDPAKAAGPLPSLFAARRMAALGAGAPETVNLYDPETGQGSVWRPEDAEAKLAEGLITEAAWDEMCDARAAGEYARWLASPDTEAERFELLRAARKVKLAEYDVAVAELRRKERAGADVTAQLAAWDAYAEALCDLPAQEGAPFDGGGELTPWPENPAVGNAQA